MLNAALTAACFEKSSEICKDKAEDKFEEVLKVIKEKEKIYTEVEGRDCLSTVSDSKKRAESPIPNQSP